MQVSASVQSELAELFKALGDPTRVRILGLLLSVGEVCGCEVEATLGITQTRASRALTTLRRVGLVSDRRDGSWVHYTVVAKPTGVRKSVLNGLRQAIQDDPVTAEDLANFERGSC